MFDLNFLIRDNVKNLTPYSSARNEFKGDKGIFLDANENPFNAPYNRYPDPLQWKVKQKLAIVKGVQAEQIFLGNGSDEAIDLLIRAFCEPHIDNIVSIQPSYGMYQVAAEINAVEFNKVLLKDDFSLDPHAIQMTVTNRTKLIMLCSPNNPTANSLDTNEILELVKYFNGIVIVDEAYIDFSTSASLIRYLPSFPNLVILQTFSKAWGMAALRMGIAFASKEIINILNKIKYPYNINNLSQQIVLKSLNDIRTKNKNVDRILEQREELIKKLSKLKIIHKIYPSDANFILIRVENARKIYDYLIHRRIIIRDRSKVNLCEGCLRITIGKRSENTKLYKELNQFEKENIL